METVIVADFFNSPPLQKNGQKYQCKIIKIFKGSQTGEAQAKKPGFTILSNTTRKAFSRWIQNKTCNFR